MTRPAGSILILALSVVALLLGCGTSPAQIVPAATVRVTPSPSSMLAPTLLPAVTPTPLVPDSGWQELRPGLARRVLNLADEERGWQENVTILRIDPAGYRFDVAYRPGRPLPLPNWQDETGALLVVNGGFYTEAYEATGLIISQGRQSGSSYGAFAGMFAVTPAGPEVRWLQQRPYDPAEPLLAALQSFPILVKPGHIAGFAEEDGQRARRTVVAQDKAGRILFLVAGMGHFTLRELSHFLASSDLELEVALNLDGGPSSGLLLAEPALHIPAFAPLPAVITVYLLE